MRGGDWIDSVRQPATPNRSGQARGNDGSEGAGTRTMSGYQPPQNGAENGYSGFEGPIETNYRIA